MNLSLDLVSGHKRGLSLANPVMTASGTFSNGLEYAKVFDIQRLGAIVSKAITLKPRRGNVQPRIAETAAGMINSIGLQNIGLEAIVRDVAPVWATWRVPVIANIAGDAISDYASLAARLDAVPGVGPQRKKALLRKFGSLQAIREAPLADLAATPGLTQRLAETIKAHI